MYYTHMILDFQQKRKFRRFLYSPVTIGILFFVTLYSIYTTWSVYQKKKESEQLVTLSETRIRELQKKQADLDQHIGKLQTDQGKEALLRDKFSVVKESENMIVIVPEESSTLIKQKTPLSLSQRIKLFFGL